MANSPGKYVRGVCPTCGATVTVRPTPNRLGQLAVRRHTRADRPAEFCPTMTVSALSALR